MLSTSSVVLAEVTTLPYGSSIRAASAMAVPLEMGRSIAETPPPLVSVGLVSLASGVMTLPPERKVIWLSAPVAALSGALLDAAKA